MRGPVRPSTVRFRLAFLFAFSFLSPPCFANSCESGFLGEGKPWQTAFYINDSGVDGPTVVVTGGVHGNEPAGSEAAKQIRNWPVTRGKLIVVPRVNPSGLDEGIRYIPKSAEDQKDLNRNFPSPGITDEPRGEIATELWNFVVKQNPDWLFDLHEGYDFNGSHKPKEGKAKSVGSSIIYDRNQQHGVLVERMLAAANEPITNSDRLFVLLGRGAKKTTLASAVNHVLGKKSMILETTFRDQPLSVRTRQHRTMMSVALRQIGIIDHDCSEVMTPPRSERGSGSIIALYDGQGGSERGVTSLTRVFDASPELSAVHLGAGDIRSDILSQFDVIVFGGGNGSEQAETIGEAGAEAVRNFVHTGGGYLGICGGAFLCPAHYSWSLKLLDSHVISGGDFGQGRVIAISPHSEATEGLESIAAMAAMAVTNKQTEMRGDQRNP